MNHLKKATSQEKQALTVALPNDSNKLSKCAGTGSMHLIQLTSTL
jgi:hypothetical protein